MRVGNNPLRLKAAPETVPSMVMGVITHLPDEKGYHEKRLEVVKACLESMRKHAPGIPVLVWDNGSGAALREWITDVYQPEMLIFSGNVGKQSARAAIVRMFPEQTVVGVSDDDMLFYPGWLDEHFKLLKGFPLVGVVSGWPVRVAFGWGNQSTIGWAEKNAKVEVGRLITDEEERDYAVSLGMKPSDHATQTVKLKDTRIGYRGLTAYAAAQHCQFVAYAGRIAPFCEWNPAAMGTERDFDCKVDQAGLLRLTTVRRTVRHMGNVIDEPLQEELRGMGL